MDTRVDVQKLYAALDAAREARALSWRQLAHDAGVSPSVLSRLGNGMRPDLEGFLALTKWLSQPTDDFVLDPNHPAKEPEPELEAQIAPLLRARKDMSKADKDYLMQLIHATVRHIRADGK